jgi:hypothetical protein
MTRKYTVTTVLGALLLFILPLGEALAYDPGPREGKWDFTVQMRYMNGQTIDGKNGSSADVNDTLGWGFGFGYNFTNNLALAMDISWANANYNAKYTAGTPPPTGGTGSMYGTLYASTIALNMTYYFNKGAVAPFVIGGIGSTFIDSNIPNGAPSTGCWYDPWYGYICNTYQSTYSSTNFSYNAGLGLRWDVAPGFFLRGILADQWVDTSQGTLTIPTFRLDIGFSFR